MLDRMQLGLRTVRLLGRLARALAGEEGQAATEYAVTTGALMLGTGTGLLVFLPKAFEAYQKYINTFYLTIGMPLP